SSLSYFEVCQAKALVDGRDYVTPGDVKEMAVPVLSHRILVKSRGADLSIAPQERARVVREIVANTDVPV
ncbi:MAG: magnesium chelatase, partial [Candidatus Hydrogenedentes bacterium]|nr:magnesium chelatase [Candidatus Hydrogenedentota bacterium]